MSFCTKCGQRLEEDDKWCTKCGEIVKQAAKDDELSEDTNQVFENTSYKDSSKK